MMKRIILSMTTAATLAAALSAHAVAPGFYMGLMLGPASNTGSTTQAQTTTGGLTTVTPSSKQFGTRIFLGNKMNQYAGYEFGLDYFTKIKYDSKDVPTCNTPSATLKAFDFLAKGTIPLGSFDVFGKAGAGMMYDTTSGSLNPDSTKSCGKSQRQTQVRPILGIGGSYDFTQNWVMDFSWTRYLVGGTIKNMDHYAVGVSYHFVDTYCGQFLC